MIGPWTSRAMAWTASKSPGEAIGKPASMTSTPRSREGAGHLELLGEVHAAAGRLLAVAQRGVEDEDAVRVGRGGHRVGSSNEKGPGTFGPGAGGFRFESGRRSGPLLRGQKEQRQQSQTGHRFVLNSSQVTVRGSLGELQRQPGVSRDGCNGTAKAAK